MSPPQPVTTILLAGPTLVMHPDGAGAEEIGGVSGPGRQAVVASARRAAVARRARVARVMAVRPYPPVVGPCRGAAASGRGPNGRWLADGWGTTDSERRQAVRALRGPDPPARPGVGRAPRCELPLRGQA